MKYNEKELHEIFIKMKNTTEKEEAFNTLYKNYHKLVYGIAFSILKNKDDSEDVSQSVFAKIYKLSKSKLPDKSESSWLYSVTKNETITYLRKKNKEINLDDDYNIYNLQIENDDIKEIENIDAYKRAIKTLSPKEQEIISLKILSGLSFREISKVLNMPIGTVQWNYYKAIHSLQLLLGNISMFVITITLYLLINRNKTKRSDEINMSAVNEEIVNEAETNITTENSTAIDNTVTNEEKTQQQSKPDENVEYIQPETREEQSIFSNSEIDISLLTLSMIFLIFIIIFAINCFKNYYNKKNRKGKNNSKM